MLYAVAIAMLGYTRLQSVTVYNSETRAFDELTPAVARRYIKSGQVAGIKWEEADNYDKGLFVPDKEGFNKHNIMVRTAAGKFRPLNDDRPGQPINSMYNVVRILKTNYRGVLFEVVSNRFDRIKITEEQLRGLNELEPVAGVWIYDDHIVSASCIKVEDRTQSLGDTVEQVDTVEAVDTGEEVIQSEQPQTMEEIFGSAGLFDGEQGTEGENPDVEQADQALKMEPVFMGMPAGQEQKKSAGSKAAGGKNRKSANSRKK